MNFLGGILFWLFTFSLWIFLEWALDTESREYRKIDKSIAERIKAKGENK